jgi:hypothetical protein
MWPLALITKPVPLLLTLFAVFDEAPGASVVAPGLAATALAAVKSPAAFKPSALILLTQLASTASSGPVDVRLNCSVVGPATATIRLAFWKVRATPGGKIAVSMMSDVAFANSFASDCPSKVTSIGYVSPFFR